MKHSCHTNRQSGFSLSELMISIFIVMLILAGTLVAYTTHQRSWHIASLRMQTSMDASNALERLVYGVGNNSGLREVEADTVSYASWPNGIWLLSYTHNSTPKFYAYIPPWQQVVDQDFKVIMDGVVSASAAVTNGGVALAVFVEEEKYLRTGTSTMGNFVEFRD